MKILLFCQNLEKNKQLKSLVLKLQHNWLNISVCFVKVKNIAFEKYLPVHNPFQIDYLKMITQWINQKPVIY